MCPLSLNIQVREKEKRESVCADYVGKIHQLATQISSSGHDVPLSVTWHEGATSNQRLLFTAKGPPAGNQQTTFAFALPHFIYCIVKQPFSVLFSSSSGTHKYKHEYYTSIHQCRGFCRREICRTMCVLLCMLHTHKRTCTHDQWQWSHADKLQTIQPWSLSPSTGARSFLVLVYWCGYSCRLNETTQAPCTP